MIEVVNVCKSYRSGTRWVEALRGISCRIDRGRFAFIVGPSGSGKSTLLYLLGALDRPSPARSSWTARTWSRCPRPCRTSIAASRSASSSSRST